MSVNWTKPLALVTVFLMLFTVEAFAGKGYHQSSGGKKKPGFFCKVGAAIKKVTQKTAKAIKTGVHKTGKAIKKAAINTGKAIKVTGAKINNAVKDTGVLAKYKLTGKKNRLWVVGHYDKNGKWTKGHWRKFEAKPVNHPGQGGSFPGQSNNPGQGNNPGQVSEPLPPVGGDDSDQTDADNGQAPAPDTGAPADGGEADAGNAGDEADAGDDAAGNTDGSSEGDDSAEADPTAPAPVPEDPVLPELPEDGEPGDAGSDNGDDTADEPEAPEAPEAPEGSDDSAQVPEEDSSDEAGQAGQTGQSGDSEESGQAAQQSGDAAQGAKMSMDEQISLRTMGMLMNDLAKQSADLTTFKTSARTGMNYSVGYNDDVNAAYELREKNARLLVKVIVWDLHQNEGKSGKYFSFFKFRMRDFDARTRRMISDVTKRVKEGVKHGAGHQTSKAGKVLYQRRLNELEGF